jgi:hypothetical protein
MREDESPKRKRAYSTHTTIYTKMVPPSGWAFLLLLLFVAVVCKILYISVQQVLPKDKERPALSLFFLVCWSFAHTILWHLDNSTSLSVFSIRRLKEGNRALETPTDRDPLWVCGVFGAL